MEQVLLSQTQLLDSLTYYLDEHSRPEWPVERIQQSMLADQKTVARFGQSKSAIGYPAADMIASFKSALQTIQGVKQRAIDDNTFAARQNARHANDVYGSLINHYNNDLLSWQHQFVNYSASVKQLLIYPKFCPAFVVAPPQPVASASSQTAPFQDVLPVSFTIKPSAQPATQATFLALTAYIEFINESLRQMNYLQVTLRNYQSSAAYYRTPSPKRSNLTYRHDEFKIPLSEYQLLLSDSRTIPQPYRASINGQAEVLLAMLKEMDGLSIELIGYTAEKRYLQDHLQRSDAILDRYAYLFEAFDRKKEQLYQDVRRIHESYPALNPTDSWYVSGKALLKAIDNNKDVLFGIKAYLREETPQLPATDKLVADARMLIENEYQNLKGLKRLGRDNGLCPYSPYEDIADNSLRFAEKTQHLKASSATTNLYEEFYYFFNNELVYEYNKFCELAKTGVLKTVNQPNMLAFRRSVPQPGQSSPPAGPVKESISQPLANTKPGPIQDATADKTRGSQPAVVKTVQHDTVFVNRTKVDTVYIDRSSPQSYANSLTGFAPNNMVLLLDVSASMDSPYKLPLLKKSIKSLLNLLRPEDQLSIVTYSGKARVVLKPTSGTKASEIAQLIDQLQSDGDTDGNGGIRLAYKVANKQYIRAGNNRIVLATDGEFAVSDEIFSLVSESAKQDVYLTIFTFGRQAVKGQTLNRLAQLGKGTYTHITPENATGQLILEAQAKKLP